MLSEHEAIPRLQLGTGTARLQGEIRYLKEVLSIPHTPNC